MGLYRDIERMKQVSQEGEIWSWHREFERIQHVSQERARPAILVS